MRRPILLTLAAAILWGTSFPAIDIGLDAIDPWTFAALRFLLAFGIVAAIASGTGRLRPRLLRLASVWLLGVCTIASFLLQFVAQTLTTPGKTALLINMSVFPVAVLSHLVFRERFGAAKIAAGLLAAAGVVLLATEGRLEALAGGVFLGDMLAFLSGLAWAGFAVASKRVFEREGTLPVIVWVFGIAAAALLPIALLLGKGLPQTPEPIAAALYVGVLCTAAAFVLFGAGLRELTPTVSAIVLVLEIVVALAVSLALDLEELSPERAVGAVLVLAAVALASLPDPAFRRILAAR